ncbi:MAG: hypothetical protein LBS89_08100 [Zoogloeaceae bacterium]|jgi:hypothetical protein|nr:hypothetical protein [Zoogloeaceae bacterium]
MNVSLAWQETCKNLAPALQAACRQTPVSGSPAALLRQLEAAQPEWPFQYRFNRGGWYRLGGVVDGDGKRVSDNLEHWAERALKTHDGDLTLLLEMLEDTPLYATRLTGSTHYLIARTGDAPADFLQLEIEALQEMRGHRLGAGEPNSLNELIDPVGIKPDLQAFGQAAYHFRRLAHIGALLTRMTAQSTEPPPILRLLADWQASSAGNASDFSNHWLIALREYLDRYQQTQYRAQPIAIGSGKPPAFELVQGTNGLKLQSALHAFDHETGYPFSWFFHLLTTRAVPHWVAQTVVEDALNGFAYLPQRDVEVVRNWLHRPYVV